MWLEEPIAVELIIQNSWWQWSPAEPIKPNKIPMDRPSLNKRQQRFLFPYE